MKGVLPANRYLKAQDSFTPLLGTAKKFQVLNTVQEQSDFDGMLA